MSTMLQYSGQLRTNRMNHELSREEFADAEFDISKTLLHDVILMEVRSFTMKYQAGERRKEKEKMEKIESEIDSIQNSTNEKDVERVNILKEELQELEDQKDIMNARKYLAKNQLEGERPTKFFCSMNKKMNAKTQFKEVHVKERDERGATCSGVGGPEILLETIQKRRDELQEGRNTRENWGCQKY